MHKYFFVVVLVSIFLVSCGGGGKAIDESDEGIFTGMDDITVQENKELVSGSPWCYTYNQGRQKFEAVMHFVDYTGGMSLRTYKLGRLDSRQSMDFDCPKGGYTVVGSRLTVGCGSNTMSYNFRKAFDGVFKLCEGPNSGECITIKSADCTL